MNALKIKNIISESILKSFLKTDVILPIDREVNVAAIDIGYGFTKYRKGIDKDNNVNSGLFPSIAPQSPQEEMSGGYFVDRDTKKIESGGTVWEVGPDVYDITSKSDVRALHENFINSEQWKVLFLGALAYMEMPVIDLLVLGLPVSNMGKQNDMKEIAMGVHVIGDVEVFVKDVLVVPQPLGALYNYAISNDDFDRFFRTNSLIIDPGYLTFDFLLTKGFKVNPHRSGARPGGMSAVLNAIATSVSKELDSPYDDLNEIDISLDLKNYDGPKKSRPVFIYGDEIDLVKHISNTKPVIDTSLNFMLYKIGDSKDVAQIIMAGGPNKIFQKSIKTQFPKHNIYTLKEGIFSNVTGFYLWGLMVAYGKMLEEELSKKKVS